jgi:hypothetical protein
MSKTWIWIFGVLAALVVIAVLLGAVFMWQNHSTLTFRSGVAQPPVSGTPGPNSQDKQYGFGYQRRYHMGGDGWDVPMMGGDSWNRPMMGGRGFERFGGYTPFGMGFFILGGLLHLLVPLTILALVAWGFYQVGKRAGASAGSSASPTPDKTPLPTRRVAKR